MRVAAWLLHLQGNTRPEKAMHHTRPVMSGLKVPSMTTATRPSLRASPLLAPPPLAIVSKPNLTTREAAHYLNRRPQTLRGWACSENGPIRPRRIGGLLAWPTAEVMLLCGVQP